MGIPRTLLLAKRLRRKQGLRPHLIGLRRLLRRKVWKSATPERQAFIVRMIHRLSPRRIWKTMLGVRD
jgi:hypothetical protein